jgi:hypothetical protein
LIDLSREVLAVEAAYVAAATTARDAAMAHVVVSAERALVARACAGAVASRFLAVGSPRSFGVVGGTTADRDAMVAAHRPWFPHLPDVRWTAGDDARPLREVLAADIVCVVEPLALAAAQLRRGTHVNALAAVSWDDELGSLATIVDEVAGLPALAAGLIDGRQLDELTLFVAGEAAIAIAALAALGD